MPTKKKKPQFPKEPLLQPIAGHPFFKKFDPYFFPFLSGCASKKHFREGEYLFTDGGKADAFYLVLSGEVDLEMFVPTQGKAVVQTIKEGQVIGWSWLFPPYKWHFSAKAIERTEAIVLDGPRLRAKCEADHDFGFEFFRRIANVLMIRLQATRHHILELSKILPPIRPWWNEDIP